MSFPRYPKYKPSGVEWLGDVPQHWRVLSLGRITVDRCDGPFGSGLKSEHYTDSGVRVIRLQNIRSDGFNGDDAAFIDAGYYRTELNGHDVVCGDVLIAGLGDENNTVGRACVAPAGIEPAMVKADCFRFRLDTSQSEAAFVAVQLSAGAAADAGVLSSGSTRSRIPLSVTSTRKVALPPRDEQTKIASFLDRETSKIDGLVGEQRRLIELLKEKRQAVISHAVTKGLNPHAPLKPSGIEWLGDVPEHWEFGPLKRFWDVVDCKHVTVPFLDEGYPVASVMEVREFELDLSQVLRTSEEYFQLLIGGDRQPQRGDVIYCRNTANTGTSAYVGTDDPIAIGQDVVLIKSRQQNGRFLNYILHSGTMAAQLETLMVGSTFKRINVAEIRTLSVTCPPKDEQDEIVKFLDAETTKLDALTAEAERGIELLQERRTALISAAVTGQIDVRGLVSS